MTPRSPSAAERWRKLSDVQRRIAMGVLDPYPDTPATHFVDPAAVRLRRLAIAALRELGRAAKKGRK